MSILVVNCGSSSIKYDLFDIEKEISISKGIVERIGEEGSRITHEVIGGDAFTKEVSCRDHHEGILLVKDLLTDPHRGSLSKAEDVAGVGHRVVHGGEEFHSSVLIDDKVLESIEKYSELAPLHNPPALEGIKGCIKIFASAPQVAVFDTAFHYAMPEYAYCYGLPYGLYEKYRIRKYGFHGTSHRYVAIKASEVLGRPLKELKLITVHLGNGCSICAVSGDRSVDTSMGFTPLEGLLMGTRAGDIDPAVAFFLMRKEGLDVDGVEDLLNRESGLLGVSGISNDMRDILKATDDGDKRAKLAYEMFVYRIKKYVGAYAVVLGKVDAVVFTGGIGEHVPAIRTGIEEALRPFVGGAARFISIPTNEELLIARDTYAIIKGGVGNIRDAE